VTGNDVRSRIADLVRGVQPFDGREAADRADILDWVASGKQLFRTLPPDTPPKDPREFKGIRWFGLDESQDWPADTYDPEMHRFAAKLRSALRPRQG
jgi:hypothetical protein